MNKDQRPTPPAGFSGQPYHPGQPAQQPGQQPVPVQPDYQQAYAQGAPVAPDGFGAPSAPVAPGSQQPVEQFPIKNPDGTPVRNHVHSSFVWLGALSNAIWILFILLVTSGGVIVAMIEDLLSGGRGTGLMAIGAGAGIIVLFALVFAAMLGIRYLLYKNLFFELTDSEFNLYSGILNKKRVHVPYYRVQSVDQNASLINRALGVCTVKIDTAGGASNKAIMVPFITNSQAEWLRTELFTRKLVAMNAQGDAGATANPTTPSNVLDDVTAPLQQTRGIFGGAGLDLGAITHEYGLTNKELFLTGISNSTAFVFIVLGLIMGVFQIAESASIFAPANDAMVSFAQEAIKREGFGLLLSGLGSVFLIAVALWALSGVYACISYGGFKARRRGNRVEVEYGLLHHRFQGVNIDRVQSITIKQSFIRRLFGYCEISVGKVDSTEGSNSNNQKQLAQGMVIHPFVKIDRVPEIIEGLLPEFKDLPTDNIKVAPVALRRALIRRCLWNGAAFWTALTITLTLGLIYLGINSEGGFTAEGWLLFTGIATGLYAVCVVLLILDIVGAIMWFRGSNFGFNREFVQITNSGFTKESIVFSRKKIQFASTSENPFQRRAKVATLMARTAAGVGGTTVSLRDVTREEGLRWVEWNLPRHN